MRCAACDCNLNDYESTRKYPDGSYVDLCNRCFNHSDLVDMPIVVRDDLAEYEDVTSDIDWEEVADETINPK